MTKNTAELPNWITQQAAKPAVKNRTAGKRLDHQKVGIEAMKRWKKGEPPTAVDIAKETGESLHGVRLWFGSGSSRQDGLELDSDQRTERDHDPITGENKKRMRVIFPPTSRNFAVMLKQLTDEGADLDDIARELGFDDQEDLQAAIIEETVGDQSIEDEFDELVSDFDDED